MSYKPETSELLCSEVDRMKNNNMETFYFLEKKKKISYLYANLQHLLQISNSQLVTSKVNICKTQILQITKILS